jgi:transposase
MRPIYHWTEQRIHAHICICFVAYSLAKYALYQLNVISKLKLSLQELNNELLHMQASILRDNSTRREYLLPSHRTGNQIKICKAFGIKYRAQVKRIK